MPTSQQRREELSEMAAAVSPAPIGYEQSDQCWEIACLDGDNRLDWKNEIAMVVSSEEDTKYIVAMWNSTPALLADLTAVERENAELREALQPFAALIDGNLDQVGGGTHVAPTIKVQWVKDAKAALTPPTNAPNPESE
jgi:hypothetical protein